MKPQIQITDHTLISITGPDAEKLLQGQFTCDVRTVTPEHSTLGTHCNHKGRIVSLFRLLRHQDSYYLFLPSSVLEPALAHLKKYAMFSKVTVSIDDTPCYGLFAPANQTELPQAINQVAVINEQTICRVPGDARYLVIDWSKTLTAPIDNHQWHLSELREKLPRLYPETVGEFLPHYLDLPALGAVSFTKGCYNGQEIIARMQHRGQLKQGLFLSTSTEALTPGQHFKRDNDQEAQCVDCIATDNNHYETLIIHQK